MKTLYIIPFGEERDTAFYLIDIDNGDVLASHFCSGKHFAKGDLLDRRKERKERLEKLYGEEVEAKFFNEQSDVTAEEFKERNKKLAEEHEKEKADA